MVNFGITRSSATAGGPRDALC